MRVAMTNYSAWDSKASALVRDDEEEAKKDKAEADKALGLEGGPKGPPTAKAEEELKNLGEHSDERKEFIDWANKKEVTQTHKSQEEPVTLQGEEVDNKAIRLSGSEGVTYVIPEGSRVVKLILEKCKNVKVQVLAPIITSTIEVVRCSDCSFELAVPVGCIQVDECLKPVLIHYAERDHVGQVYHQNSPGLSVGFGAELTVAGTTGEVQHYTRLGGSGDQKPFITDFVRRGESDFPVDLAGDRATADALLQAAGGGYIAGAQPEPEDEAAPESEVRQAKAELKRKAGNDMFRASDFFQAAMEYTQALELDPTVGPLYANRSCCWLKLGNHDKALEDAIKCTEVDPSNSKGWFRRGMALHAMKRYAEAIPHLLEAEKLEPKNKQIPEAIKMAQMFARKEAAGA